MQIFQVILIIMKSNFPLFLIKYVLFPLLMYYCTLSNPALGAILLLATLITNMLASDTISLSNKVIKEKFGYTPHEFFIETHTKALEKIKNEKEDNE